MKAFMVKGTMDINKRKQVFSIQIAADDVAGARAQIFSELGSRHRLKRQNVNIEDIKELKGEEITDKVVKYKTEQK